MKKIVTMLVLGVVILFGVKFGQAQPLDILQRTVEDINILLVGIVAGIAALLIIIHGIRWKMATDPVARRDAKKGIVHVLVGLLVVFIAVSLVGLIYEVPSGVPVWIEVEDAWANYTVTGTKFWFNVTNTGTDPLMSVTINATVKESAATSGGDESHIDTTPSIPPDKQYTEADPFHDDFRGGATKIDIVINGTVDGTPMQWIYRAECPYISSTGPPVECTILYMGSSSPTTATQPAIQTLWDVAGLLLGIVAGIAVLLIIIHGIRWKTATSPEDRREAKRRIWNVIVGLLLVIMAPALVQLIYVVPPTVPVPPGRFYYCSSLSSCEDAINNAAPGDTVFLTRYISILSYCGTGCINWNNDGVIFNCQGNKITNRGGAPPGYDESYGIYMNGHSGNTIKNCEFVHGNGVKLENSDDNTLDSNTFEYNGYGINLENSNSNTLDGNTVERSGGKGIKLENSNSNTLKGNMVNDNSNGGILFTNSNSNTLKGNMVNDNSNRGIYITMTSTNTNLSNNEICGNGVKDIQIGALCSGNTWSGNTCKNSRVRDDSGDVPPFTCDNPCP